MNFFGDDYKYDNTKGLVINLFGGPGVGKSTTMAEVFAYLKRNDRNVEMAPEFAKQLVWDNRHFELDCQEYIFGKQAKRLFMLKDQVEAIVTDAPLINSIMYAKPDYPEGYKEFVLRQFHQYENMNFVLTREKKYNPKGRTQTLEKAKDLDVSIREILELNYIPYRELSGNVEAAKVIGDAVIEVLNQYK